MATGGVDPFLIDVGTYLVSAVVAVPLAKRLGLGSVVGYLIAGAAIGPYGLGFIGDSKSVLQFAEFGVVLLLFVIGLELQPARLWRLRTEIFGLGLAQVALTGVLLALVVNWLGWMNTNAAIAVGGALALSSTAFAIQILRERGDLTKPYGDRAFSILLFQDLAIVPLLALVAFLSPWAAIGTGGDPVRAGVTAIAAVVGLIVVGHFGLRPLFRMIAATKSDEIFTAAALLVVIASAAAMQMAGLSMAMGAFLAGVLLAESEFRHQLETDIEPFRGLLLGLLFIAVGMSVAWPLIVEHLGVVVIGAIALFAFKMALIAGLCRLFGSSWGDALRIGGVLGQGGEFAFVLFTVGLGNGLFTQAEVFILTSMVTATMAITPIGIYLAGRLARKSQLPDMTGIQHVHSATAGQVIVVGFGRFGQIVARILKLRGFKVTLIDNSPARIRIARTFGDTVFFGDVRRGDILRAAGAENALAVFLCADDPDAVRHAAQTLRWRFPHLKLFARAHDRVATLELDKAGVDGSVREMMESSIALARMALEELGDSGIADEVVAEFRRRDAELLRLQSEFGAQEGYEKMRQKFDLKNES